MNLIKSAQIIMALFPIVTSVVKDVESTVNTPSSGSQKLQLALSIVRTIYEQTEESKQVPFDNVVSAVTGMVAAIVNFYNQVKTFATTAKAA